MMRTMFLQPLSEIPNYNFVEFRRIAIKTLMNVKGKEWRMFKILNNIFNVNKLKMLFEKTHKKLGSVVKLRHENAQNAKTDQF